MTSRPGSFSASIDTDVPIARSVDQIRQLVEKFGALEFSVQYDPDTHRPAAVSFRVIDKHLAGQAIPVAVRAPVEELCERIRAQRRSWDLDRIRERAERVAWRNLHDFVRASLIAVDTGIMTLAEAFMASLVVTLPTGEAKRLGELAAEGNLLRAEDSRLRLGRGT